jgi:hypothetical protein
VRTDTPSLSELKRALRWPKQQYEKRALKASRGDDERIRRIICATREREKSLRRRIS